MSEWPKTYVCEWCKNKFESYLIHEPGKTFCSAACAFGLKKLKAKQEDFRRGVNK